MNTTTKKPKAQVIGQDGNVFNLMEICSRVLKKAGQQEQAKLMTEEVFKCKCYEDALLVMSKYCELT